MNVDVGQRWTEKQMRWVPRRALFDKRGYEVAEIPGDAVARDFVLAHHYSGSLPAARFRFGLYRAGQLHGVAVFSVPCRNEVLTKVFPGDPMASIELGRLVLLDEVAFNGESWFVSRCWPTLARSGIRGVVSFSDPMRRTSIAGHVVMPGHIGGIYQALGARFWGRAKARILRLLPDGTVFSERAMSKVRLREKGWEYAARQLVEAGAPAPTEVNSVWLRIALASATRPLRHPGNFRYLFAVDRAVPTVYGPTLQYPKPHMLDSAVGHD